MLTESQKQEAVATSDDILDEAPPSPKIYLCLWCVIHGAPAPRWFMYSLDESQTMYTSEPTDGRIPSHGLCKPCLEKIKAARPKYSSAGASDSHSLPIAPAFSFHVKP